MSPLLKRRMKEWRIPALALDRQALFHRVFLWQISDAERTEAADKVQGTSIFMPEKAKKRLRDEAPRAVLVSAGAVALDQLRTNGGGLGHIVTFVRLAPWRIPIGFVDAKEVHLHVTHASDIVGSEDLAVLVNEDRAGYRWDEESGQHVFVDETGFKHKPQATQLSEDY